MLKRTGRLHLEIWDQQRGEGAKPFAAFILYRDGGADTSLAKVAEQLEISNTLVTRWSGKFHWVERKRAFTAFIDKEATQKGRIEAQSARVAMLHRHTQVAVLIQNKAVERLSSMTESDWKALSFGQILQAFQMMAQFERLSRGLPSDSIEIRTPDQIEEQRITEAMLYLKEVKHDFPILSEAEHLQIVCDEFEVTPDQIGYSLEDLSDKAIG